MGDLIKEISIKEMEGMSVGHAQDDEAGTGVSVIYFPGGALAGCDISGGGPASRETPLTSPLTADNPINAVVLSGGSAFGLAAGAGVVRCLEENGAGYDTGYATVPLVCQSCIYDLGFGSADVRPDETMGYAACRNAMERCDDSIGNVGAGTGATVGKLCGMGQADKSGLGVHAVQAGELRIAAVVAVNAFGDIYEDGRKIAGLLDPESGEFLDFMQLFTEKMCAAETGGTKDLFNTNTTIGCIVTNAAFDKAKLNKIASMTRNAYARCINPVGTMADGDSIYACSVGDVDADINLVGTLSAHVMEKAVIKAVKAAKEQIK